MTDDPLFGLRENVKLLVERVERLELKVLNPMMVQDVDGPLRLLSESKEIAELKARVERLERD